MPEKQYKSPLVGQRLLVPAAQDCPYKSECVSAKRGACNHKGTKQLVDFSCAFARGFNIIYRNEFYNGRPSHG
jgi:hypothetical protein